FRRRNSLPWRSWPVLSASSKWPADLSFAPVTMPTKWCPMPRPIILPDLGVRSAVLSVWFVNPGDRVYAGDRLVEILAGSATFDVSSPATGWLVEKLALPDDSLYTGQVLGVVEENDE